MSIEQLPTLNYNYTFATSCSSCLFGTEQLFNQHEFYFILSKLDTTISLDKFLDCFTDK